MANSGSLSGSLHSVSLQHVLMSIETTQRTGRLVISRGVPIAYVYFAGGQWMVGERLGAPTSLAEQLVQAGMAFAQQLEFSFGIPFYQIITIPDRQFAQMLTSSGLATSEQLRAWLTQDAAEMLATMLGWQDGDFTFEDGVAFPPHRLALPLQTSMLLAGVSPLPRNTGGLSNPIDTDVVLDFTEVNPHSEGAIEVTRDQWRLLSVVDGQRPLWALAGGLRLPEEAVSQLAGELVSGNLAVEVGRVPRG
ncbi:MAG TPA: DUF4388 domain-containing protein [Ktedonobacterales bacterium]